MHILAIHINCTAIYVPNLLIIYTCIVLLLQEILTCNQCIVFNSDQYKKIYWSLINENDTSLLQFIINKEWAKVRKHPEEWKNYGNC